MSLGIVYGTYKNRACKFSSPSGLRKFMARVPVGCNCLLISIDFYYWYKISFKLISQDLLCCLLTSLFWIYRIIVHWYCNLYFDVIGNFLRGVYKLKVQIFFPHRFAEGHGKGDCFVILLVIISLLNSFKVIISRFPIEFV